jgi:error-prone DNA polymerase
MAAGQLLARIRALSQIAVMKPFSDVPRPSRTAELSARLDFTLANLGYEFPNIPWDRETMNSFLRQRTDEGARQRYRPYHEKAQRQIDELALIEKLDLAGYFLIVWDLVDFCRREKILCKARLGGQQRGVLCAGITAADPVAMEATVRAFSSEER